MAQGPTGGRGLAARLIVPSEASLTISAQRPSPTGRKGHLAVAPTTTVQRRLNLENHTAQPRTLRGVKHCVQAAVSLLITQYCENNSRRRSRICHTPMSDGLTRIARL